MEYGIFGLVVLALGIYAIINIIGSGATSGSKVLWILLVLVLPVVGFIIWFFAGPKGNSSAI